MARANIKPNTKNVMIPPSTNALAIPLPANAPASQARQGLFALLAMAWLLLFGAAAQAQTTNWLFFPFTDATGSNTTVSSTALGGVGGVVLTGYNGAGTAVDLHGAVGSGVNGGYNGDRALCLTNGDTGSATTSANNNGAADCVADKGDALLAGTITNFVISMWINEAVALSTNTGFTLPRLFVLSPAGANDDSANTIGVKFQTGNQYELVINAATTTTGNSYNAPANTASLGVATVSSNAANTWYFVSWAYDGTNLSEYTGSARQAATLVAQYAAPGLTVNLGSTPWLVIGDRGVGGTRGFYGWIQDFRIDLGVPTNTATFLEGVRQSGPAVILDANFYDDSINVDYGGGNAPAPSAMSGAAVIGTTNDVWNGLHGFTYSPYPSDATYTAPSGSLVYTDGARSAVTLSLSAPNGSYDNNAINWGSYTPFSWASLAAEDAGTGYPNTPYAALMATLISTAAGTTNGYVNLGGLVPGGVYNLYVYSAGNAAGRASTFVVNGVTNVSTYDAASSTFISGVDYLEFAGVTADTNGNLAIDFGNNGVSECDFNGFQLQFVSGSSLPATTAVPPTMTSTTNLNGLTLCTNTSITFTAVSAANTLTNFLVVIKTSQLGSTNITTNTANFNANGTFSGTTVAGINSSPAAVTLPLSQNLKYSITVTATDSTGLNVQAAATFDTFAPALVIEASDYNFSGGSWYETPGNGGVWLYTNVLAVSGTDIYKQGSEGPNALFYRDLGQTMPPNFPYITEANADTFSEQKFALATTGAVIGSNDFPALSIGYDTAVPSGTSDWQNYTRTFGTNGYPTDSATNGTYNVWLFMSIAGGGEDATFSSVSNSTAVAASQVVTPIGQFGTASFSENDWNGFEYVPMTDAYGNLLATTIASGPQTFQLMVGPKGGPNLGFLMFMPAAAVLTPGFSSFYPDGAHPFEPTNHFTFTVTPHNGSNILGSGIDLVLNGVDVTANPGFTVTPGVGGTWIANYPVSSNAVYTAVMSVTNTAGLFASLTVNFDTFNPGNYQWEAVDYDFSTNNGNGVNGTNGPPVAMGLETFGGWISGLHIESNVPSADITAAAAGPVGTELTNSYFGYPIDFTSAIDPFGAGAIAQQGVDIYVTANGQSLAYEQYRWADTVGAQVANDYIRPKFTAARTLLNDTNIGPFNICYFNAGNWLNYTHNYPAGSYNVWGRLANNANYSTSFGQVTSGVGTGTQTVQPLGTFTDTNATGFQAWHWIPLLDTNGNKVVVDLTGSTTTFRATAITAQNMEFFMLAAAEPSFTVTASIVPGPLLNLAFPTVIGHNYQLLYESSVAGAPAWAPVGSVITGTGAVVNVTRPLTGTQGYYKVMVQ